MKSDFSIFIFEFSTFIMEIQHAYLKPKQIFSQNQSAH